MPLDREAAVAWYTRNRERSRALFGLLSDEAFYSQPIALRHPIVFYAGHLPAFSFNTLVKRGLGCPSIDPRLETLFARGIDPSPDEPAATAGAADASRPRSAKAGWPGRGDVEQFAAEADRRVLDALAHADLDRPGHPLLDRAEAVFAILEHEAMHQETLLYMWQRLPFEDKRRPAGYEPIVEKASSSLFGETDDNGVRPVFAADWVEVPAGRATLGVNRDQVRFGWDNEQPSASADVSRFSIGRHNVTNAQFLAFVNAGGYEDPRWWNAADWQWIQREKIRSPSFWEYEASQAGQPPRWSWRGMFDRLPLPPSWPVYVSHAEAAAYARWSGGRLPTEAEYQRAAYGTPTGDDRPYPWGAQAPTAARGVFDFASWDPQPAGTHPDGVSAWGIHDLVGNGWEWTATPFAPFPGFRPMASYPEYSADFFDGEHFVMKGASTATARELIRPTFRNWFRAYYPYVFATFRCVDTSR